MKELNEFELAAVAGGSFFSDLGEAIGEGVGYAAHVIFNAENRAIGEGATYHSAG